MDSLFLMQRYWGSDDEKNTEENTFRENPNVDDSIISTKLKSGIRLIQTEDEDVKNCNSECVTISQNRKVSSKNKLHRNQKLELSVAEIDDLNYNTFPNTLKSTSEAGNEIETLDIAESSNCFEECITYSEGSVCLNKDNVSKKRKKHKSNNVDVQFQKSDEIIHLENNLLRKGKKQKLSDLDIYENEEITYLKSSFPRKGKKFKLDNLDIQENDDEVTHLKTMVSKEEQRYKFTKLNIPKNDADIAHLENNVTKKKKRHKLNNLDVQDDGEKMHLETNMLKKDKCKIQGNDIIISQENNLSNKANKCSLINMGKNNDAVIHLKNSPSNKKKKCKLNNQDAETDDEVSYLENSTSKKNKKCKLNCKDSQTNEENHLQNSKAEKKKKQKLNSQNLKTSDEISNLGNNISKKKKHCLNNEDVQANDEFIEVEHSTLQDTEKTFCTIGHVENQKDIKVKHALPYWLCSPTYISVNLLEEDTPISELSYLDCNTKKNLKDIGICYLFPVQLAVIPWLMQSKEQSLLIRPSDICVSAPTGSGKTLAFVLPIVQSLKDRVVCAIRALVVLPVNELAFQIYKVFETFVRGTDLKVALLTGQKSFASEQNALVKSDGEKVQNLVDIVVTTPGRLLDHIYRTKGFCLKCLRYLVIDEADRMIEEIQQGWLKKVEEAVFHNCIIRNCVCSGLRTHYETTSAFNFGLIAQPLQKLLYSATLTHDPEQLYSLSLYKPKLFTTSTTNSEQEYTGTYAVPLGLTMLQVACEEGVKPMVICHLIRNYKFKRVLCFTESVERAHRLHLVLEKMGVLQVREISSFNRAVQRKIVLDQFSSGKLDILVCSDIVARGIDIENVDCVISYDVPQFIKTYIHRIGRTARAGKIGTAVTLLSEGEIPSFRKILEPTGIGMPQKVVVNLEDLKPLVSLYKTALAVADSQLKKEKHQVPVKPTKKDKSKCKQNK